MKIASKSKGLDRRAQQRAQAHLNYQAIDRLKPQRSVEIEDIFSHTSATTLPVHNGRQRLVNGRTLLTAGTFLALLTGGQAAAALADAPSLALGSLAPSRHRRTRRAAGASLSESGSRMPAYNLRMRHILQFPSLEPIRSSEPPSVPVWVVGKFLWAPPPYDPADILTFMRGASIQDFKNVDLKSLGNVWADEVVPACADEVSRILGTSAPFTDADVMFFSRIASSDQLQSMSTRYPEFANWQDEVSKRWPFAETLSRHGTMSAPLVPYGPPVNLTASGRPDVNTYLKVSPGSPDLPPQFVAGNETVRLVGYNVATPGTVPCTVTLGNFTSTCETVAKNGGNSLRLFAFQSMGGPGRWQNFDNALSTARAHGLKIVWVLGNQWGDCENIEPGTAADGYHEPSWYQTGYKQAGGGNAQSYRDFALSTVQRYKNEPTVAMWSLLNEAEAGTVVQGTTCPNETFSSQAMAGFVADMASAIRAVDSNHLLTLGTRGQENNCGLQGDNYLAVQKPLDVLSLHGYAMSYDRAQTLSDFALTAGKPLFMGEHAQCADFDDCSPSSDPQVLESRACQMHQFAVSLAGLGVAGEMPWHLEGPNSTVNGFSIMSDDPLVSRLKRFAAGGSFPVDEIC